MDSLDSVTAVPSEDACPIESGSVSPNPTSLPPQDLAALLWNVANTLVSPQTSSIDAREEDSVSTPVLAGSKQVTATNEVHFGKAMNWEGCSLQCKPEAKTATIVHGGVAMFANDSPPGMVFQSFIVSDRRECALCGLKSVMMVCLLGVVQILHLWLFVGGYSRERKIVN